MQETYIPSAIEMTFVYSVLSMDLRHSFYATFNGTGELCNRLSEVK